MYMVRRPVRKSSTTPVCGTSLPLYYMDRTHQYLPTDPLEQVRFTIQPNTIGNPCKVCHISTYLDNKAFFGKNLTSHPVGVDNLYPYIFSNITYYMVLAVKLAVLVIHINVKYQSLHP